VPFGTLNISETANVTGDNVMQSPVGANPPTINNTGTARIDVNIAATYMTRTESPYAYIGSSNIYANVNLTAWQDLGWERTFDVNITPGATGMIDYALYVPEGTLWGNYTGTTTVSAIAG
jgi:hypothetical protein